MILAVSVWKSIASILACFTSYCLPGVCGVVGCILWREDECVLLSKVRFTLSLLPNCVGIDKYLARDVSFFFVDPCLHV